MFEPPLKVGFLMRNFEPHWFVAGGWAIDLFLEEQTRPHEDIEIAIFRKEQLQLQKHLQNWNLKKVAGGELLDWKKDEFLELPIHEIHCFNDLTEPPMLEVLLNETNGKEWIFRRDERITKPVSKLFFTAKFGIKYLRPEVVLLYKSKNPRAKDEQDFNAAGKHLDSESKEWLKNALSICYSQHRWIQNL
jgi:hypothetical protein